MPLTAKGQKIKSALTNQYGHEKGRQVFYALKNKGKISGVDDSHVAPHLKGTITALRDDDFQHMGFTSEEATPIRQIVTACDILEACDSLAARFDAFQRQQHQRKPVDVKPRTKDNMQPSNPHPKEVG